jgi:hypothetical protein
LRLPLNYHSFLRALALSFLFAVVLSSLSPAQQAPQKPPEKSNAKASTPTESQNPAQIELLETRYRFEANGDSRKEVHARVHINSELGVRQFARLNFDYNRSFQSVDIPLVHITHPSGGTADILPSAITDNPNPAVINAPAYQDVRVKAVRILGLEPGDNLEYRVITTTTHHPLAPDFWLDHSFDRTGVVSQEIFELDLPASRFEVKKYPVTPTDPLGVGAPQSLQIQGISENGVRRSSKPGRVYVSPETPETSRDRLGQEDSARLTFKWNLGPQELQKQHGKLSPTGTDEPDVVVSTFASWSDLAIAMGGAHIVVRSTSDLLKLELATAGSPPNRLDSARSIYELISRKVRTIDLPFDIGMGLPSNPFDTISNGYGTAFAKGVLFEELTVMFRSKTRRLFAISANSPENELARPSAFSTLLVEVDDGTQRTFLDPSMEVAPFGLVSANLRGKKAMRFAPCALDESNCWLTIPKDPPFPSKQHVSVDALLLSDGKLTAKVHYSLRGDNELLLRVAFHQSPKDNWKDLAQLLSLSDGFRGQVTSVNASDPYATREPFTVDYEITQPKFVDWSRKPLRIPALLPQLGLPDPPAKPAPGAATAPIELGTPLEVETRMTLHLPPGTTATAPTGTSVQRDYATFSSQYAAPTQYTRKGLTVTASRHLNFLLRQVPAERAADYNAFLRAVLNDQAQDFTLDRESAPAAAPKAAPSEASPPTSPKP